MLEFVQSPQVFCIQCQQKSFLQLLHTKIFTSSWVLNTKKFYSKKQSSTRLLYPKTQLFKCICSTSKTSQSNKFWLYERRKVNSNSKSLCSLQYSSNSNDGESQNRSQNRSQNQNIYNISENISDSVKKIQDKNLRRARKIPKKRLMQIQSQIKQQYVTSNDENSRMTPKSMVLQIQRKVPQQLKTKNDDDDRMIPKEMVIQPQRQGQPKTNAGKDNRMFEKSKLQHKQLEIQTQNFYNDVEKISAKIPPGTPQKDKKLYLPMPMNKKLILRQMALSEFRMQAIGESWPEQIKQKLMNKK